MKASRILLTLAPAAVALLVDLSPARAQSVVINELVKEQRTAGSGSFNPDDREFIELYNPTGSPIDISGWSILTTDLVDGSTIIPDTIPGGTTIPAGGYWVIGAAGVPNVNYTPPGTAGTELYPDQQGIGFELRDASNTLIDAVAIEVFRPEVLTGTSTDFQNQVGSGFQGQLLSMNANAPNSVASWGRYRDGVDTNRNGYDFGVLPVSPGASNNLAINGAHTVPDVNGMSAGSVLPDDYFASFVLPTVFNPGVATAKNPTAIPASPQGGNAIVAWDESGGGNSSYSKELVSSFSLYAYLDTAPIGYAATSGVEEWETTLYGIGTTDAFFGNPDPTGGIYVEGAVLQNASSGIGWMYQRYENPDGPSNFQKLVLVDMGDGGNAAGDAGEWTVIQDIDVSGMSSGWYELGIDYDETTGDVTATFDGTTYMFTTETDLAATFFVGYREALTGATGLTFAAPPRFDLLPAAVADDADFNDDLIVDGTDFLIWQQGSGLTGSATNGDGDANGDGSVNAADLAIWQSMYGTTSSVAAVPEPATVGLALLGAVGVLGAATRRRMA